jgi:7-carboxy-7-deazaguanine synthase
MKCPSSGESGKNLLENIRHLTSNDELKFVIGNREDFDFAKKIVDMLPKYHGSRRKVLFSAVFGALEPRELAGWILENGLNVRLQLQLHKYIWNPDLRGV